MWREKPFAETIVLTQRQRSFLPMRISLACLLSIGLSAEALAECPATNVDHRLGVISSAASCDEAVRLFKKCAIGASLDGRLALRAVENCEKRFLPNLPEVRQREYRKEIEVCNAPYVSKQGTIYRSKSAHCRVSVALKYSKQER
jgi:hypothetical protein